MVSTLPVYIISAAFACVFLILSVWRSNSIKYEGGSNPRDPFKRKFWFWTLAILAAIANLAFGLFNYYFPENNAFARSQLINAIGISTGLSFVVYVLLGFILSKLFRNGKLGDWF